MMADASDMLAAALEQMDGIIAGSKTLDYSNGMYDCQSPTSPFMGSLRALHLLEDLRSVLELMDTEERESLRCQIPDSTADSLVEWLHGHLSNGHISLSGSDHYQERLSRIECDKESLVLQVSVLTDQVEAQGEKIRDLDMCLDEHRDKLNATEEMLQQEILCRTTLETQKLELISEVSNLRLKQNTLEKDRLDFDDRFRDSEVCELLLRKGIPFLLSRSSIYARTRTQGIAFNAHCHHRSLCLGPDIMCLSAFWVSAQTVCSSPSPTRILVMLILWVLVFTAEMERQGTDHLDLAGLPQRSANSDSTNTLSTTPESRKKSEGIKKLFGKLKRSQSTTFNLDDNLPEGDFKRGGVRATAGPRLGWSRDLKTANNDVDAPFARWSKDQVCDWLQGQGLGLHVNMARGWISSGQTLLQASQQDLERELGIKHPLHRKKLQLALQALGSEEDDNKGKLDYHWVTRWLDDIGLPQYKTQFDEGRVDGRMLHYMTVDDLLSLKVGSVLHHLSIKRAIQVLRLNNYEPNCLRRRPSDENNISPAEISQWTNHRVMEWLRSADLAEYAPNLRGSGVHGGLMVLEPRFNVETMALLLNIPPNKTLLRRHLGTHFNLLIGLEAQQLKQECLENPDYTLLTATTKVKPRKLSFGNFGSIRRKKQDETEEYVCPMDVEMPKGRSFQKGFELQIYEDDLDRLEQMEDSEGTVRQIGAFSEGIQNLTSMLKDDEFFKEASNSPNPSVTDEDSNA
uniref:PPFIA binding protein 1b n=1 Tax=Gasterosteus aculeatus aculeatus TaxID=481459 RepID=A0AAQ4S1T1_GASAC